jgi:hypothetical protein
VHDADESNNKIEALPFEVFMAGGDNDPMIFHLQLQTTHLNSFIVDEIVITGMARSFLKF